MPHPPKISVVTASYNQAEYLEETILSVLTQGYPNLEYIIIDGGSTDRSIEILKKYDRHLAYWVSEKDSGQYDAINKGFTKASGDIFYWINSDDKLCPWSLKVVGEIFEQFHDVNWLTSRYPLNWRDDGICSNAGFKEILCKDTILDGLHIPNDLCYYGWIQQESTFWRRNLWAQCKGLNCRYHLAADTDLWLRFAELSDIYLCETPLGGFRRTPNQRSEIYAKEYLEEANAALQSSFTRTKRKKQAAQKLLTRRWLNRLPALRRITTTYRYNMKCITPSYSSEVGRRWSCISTYA